jgi:hypothetical protein
MRPSLSQTSEFSGADIGTKGEADLIALAMRVP